MTCIFILPCSSEKTAQTPINHIPPPLIFQKNVGRVKLIMIFFGILNLPSFRTFTCSTGTDCILSFNLPELEHFALSLLHHAVNLVSNWTWHNKRYRSIKHPSKPVSAKQNFANTPSGIFSTNLHLHCEAFLTNMVYTYPCIPRRHARSDYNIKSDHVFP